MDKVSEKREVVMEAVVTGKPGLKTARVRVQGRKRHVLFGKVVRWHKDFLVHDSRDLAVIGDVVSVISCRPISKNKHWRIGAVKGKK